MLTWQYCTVEWDTYKDTVIVTAPDGQVTSSPGQRLSLAVQRLNALGVDGWEVIACVTPTPYVWCWTLRRSA